MPRRTHRGGQAQLERHFEAANKTAAGFAKYHKLEIDKVEGKASCWLIAVLANIEGALVNHRHPVLEDRYLEIFLRNRILQKRPFVLYQSSTVAQRTRWRNARASPECSAAKQRYKAPAS